MSRVLVVEDEQWLRKAMQRLLVGHEVHVAADGSEALAMLTAEGPPFDVVLCDFTLPHLNGMELYSAIGAISPQVARRFVFITAGSTSAAGERFLASVSNPVLEKPCAPEEIVAAVHRAAALQ